MPALSVPSQARIVNAAYAELGSTTKINSIDDPAAHRALVLWDDIVSMLLVEHPWDFQIGRAMVNATSALDLTLYEYAYAAQLPQTCGRWLPPAQDDPNYFRGEVEGRFLLLDRQPPVLIRFIRNDVTIAEWSPHFVRAVILELAHAMCDGVTQAEGKKDRLEMRAAAALRKAKRIDGLQKGTDRRGAVVVRSDWLRARIIPNSQMGR